MDAIFYLAIGAALFWWFSRRTKLQPEMLRAAASRVRNIGHIRCAGCDHVVGMHHKGRGECRQTEERDRLAIGCECEAFQ